MKGALNMSESIARADEFICANSGLVNRQFMPIYHCVHPVGWINDPNGFSYWKGQYHLFSQFYPYKPVWGPMHWGHWVSRDLVKWDWVGTALAPDSPFDDLGCFSGTAVPDGDRLILMYTGVHKDASGRTVQEQCIATTTDGVHFEKWPCNPVINASHLPADGSPVDFRDPKLLRTDTGWRAIVANRGEKVGRQLSFSSPDLINWTCDGIFLEGIGEMPECPDYFDLDGKKAMITCAIGMEREGLRFPSTQPVVYLLGQETDGRLMPEVMDAMDNGTEFYAPETVLTPDGRRVMLGWLHMWGHKAPTQYLGHNWCGMYSLPRELFIKDGRMCQRPLEELKALRGEEFSLSGLRVQGETAAEGLTGRHYELEVELTPNGDAEVELRLMRTGDEYFSLRYDPASRIITCDRSRGGYELRPDEQSVPETCSRAVVPGDCSKLRLRIFVDTSSVEVFVNDGAPVLSMRNYPTGEAQGISFAGDFTIDSLRKWELRAAK